MLVLAVQLYQSNRLVNDTLINETNHVLEALAIASEANAAPQNIQRVIFNLASKGNVTNLVVINSANGKIVGDIQGHHGGRPYQQVLNADELALLSQHNQRSTSHHGDIVTTISTIQLIDNEIIRLRPHWVILTLDPSDIVAKARKDLMVVALTFLLGLSITLLGIYWIQQWFLILPLRRYEKVVRRQKNLEGLALIEHQRKDELGILANAYNMLVIDNQRRRLELDKYTQDLYQAKQDAEQASHAKSSFLASMSHEIRTPLNGVLGMVSLLEKSELDSAQRHKLSLARKSGESLLVLINDILDFSKIEADKLEFEQCPFDLREMLGSLAESLALRAQEKGLELILNLSGVEESTVVGDVVRLRQVITNLVGNAIKFTYQGEIGIDAKLTAQGAQEFIFTCSINDTGIGIPADKKHKLFDSFSQVDESTTRKFGGTGLGLAISKRLCELMGGDLCFESTAGLGSQFTATAVLRRSETSIKVLPSIGVPAPCIGVISANQQLRQALTEQLRKWQIRVAAAKNWSDLAAIEQLLQRENRGQAGLLIDYPLVADEDGQQQLAKLNQPTITCIAMVNLDTQLSEDQYKGLAIDFTFPKPVTTEDLFNSLDVIVNGKSSHDGLQYTDSSQETAITAHEFPDARILLVEDNPINQEVMLGLLSDYGIVPTVANNGEEALQVSSDHDVRPFDLIFMDCQMPVLDGYETTRRIRGGAIGEHQREIPIIALTANAMSDDRAKCLAVGMSDYLSKPIDPDNLEKVLTLWLSRCQQNREVVEASGSNTVTTNSNVEIAATWDKTSALRRVRNREKRLQTLVNIFLEDMPEQLDELGSAVKAHNIASVQSMAHAIKGSAGNLSAYSTMEAASELELACQQQQINDLDIKYAVLSQRYREAESMLRHYVQ